MQPSGALWGRPRASLGRFGPANQQMARQQIYELTKHFKSSTSSGTVIIDDAIGAPIKQRVGLSRNLWTTSPRIRQVGVVVSANVEKLRERVQSGSMVQVVQTIFRNRETGETIVRHTVTDDLGRVVDDHWRPFYKPRVGDLFDGN
jgi:hypothetical protein